MHLNITLMGEYEKIEKLNRLIELKLVGKGKGLVGVDLEKILN